MPSLIEILIAAVIAASVSLAVVRGGAPSPVHATALALERALAEARAIAPAGDGSTVVIEADGDGSRLRVFSSRPIPGAAPPASDAGFPPIHVAGTVRFRSDVNALAAPFAIMLSRAGYASAGALHGTYAPSATPAFDRDPGCAPAATLIVTDAGGASEAHGISCVGGDFAAN